ncbi:undecaprenyldiphospho-muramoylpentapeptide beta-N-acetylglucosaminyltransferase [Alginatibacterium sediminis]|uniref:UDP-N-acetylglucosamine--N-acetylmuramyl-(pentapeptide) pyrophosphoryl-undecaprenol N-acetylglucosamine transferase n=1 Tax=Alginatibacterium sediminis TaxID=2164068 RepID=A0A420E9A8_9ALTE|nr:undecaprenyldiphospho-muramoylpentapeptide beta-N-acetylglucosaminyltransferase [Alginatibacterium sediminis]RKF15884.1 undecaprenyldiphospho-muramoylpentapeptide beta-N-acetylglucosaminyltransferase [Alginatibacterium sediminis]
MHNSSAPRLLVMAGGTGGHVFPGIAVAKELLAQGWEVTWLGTRDRMEAQLVPQHGFDIDFIDIQGVRGNGLVRRLAAPFKIVRAVVQAIGIIRRLRPDVVIGMGGFASGPGGVAARLLGIPLVLHEQNAAAGLTNKLLAKIAQCKLQAFPGALPESERTFTVGNPVRSEITAVPEYVARPANPLAINILVVGGSLGARVFNTGFAAIVDQMSELTLEIKHQSGRGNADMCLQSYQQLLSSDQLEHIEVMEFCDDMAAAYAWADVIVCRAGALTVSEVAAAGRCAIFVPYPYAVDDHQTQNAQYLVSEQAAYLVADSDFGPESLSPIFSLLSQPEHRLNMARKTRALAQTHATQAVAQHCTALLKREENDKS